MECVTLYAGCAMLAPTLTLVLPMDLQRNQIWFAKSVALTTKPLLLLHTFIDKEGFFSYLLSRIRTKVCNGGGAS